MRQYQCKRGHVYQGSDAYDPGCSTCAAEDAELTKTRAFYEPTPTTSIDQNQGRDTLGKTVGFYDHLETSTEPVVGWLACAAGPDKGKDWRLIEGKNSIGRSSEMVVCLGSDTAVSKDRHAYVKFEPRQQVFSLLPGESRGLVYLNGVEIDLATTLAPYDRIEIGKSTLIFVPLAGSKFRWD